MAYKELEIIEISVIHNNDRVCLELPLDFAKYLGVSKGGKYQKVFVIPTNGILQLSSREPIATIPSLIDADKSFNYEN